MRLQGGGVIWTEKRCKKSGKTGTADCRIAGRLYFQEEYSWKRPFLPPVDGRWQGQEQISARGRKRAIRGTDSKTEKTADTVEGTESKASQIKKEITKDKTQSIGITEVHITEIREYLTALDLIVDCPIETVTAGAHPMEHILFTQPGMRYCQAQALVYSILKDETFFSLSEYEKKMVTERILEEVRGRMMEDIVLLETMKVAERNSRVFKLQFAADEFDMVVYDTEENYCDIYEIKHSEKAVSNQYRHLVDEEKCRQTEGRFGEIRGRYVLYRGEDMETEAGVIYQNVENYLKSL